MEQFPLFELRGHKGAPIPLDQKVQTELVTLGSRGTQGKK